MAVSPLLNDLALAAATDRAIVSRKAQAKGREVDFSNTLSNARQESAVNDSSKRPPVARPQAKPDPRDQRSSEISHSENARRDLQESKIDALRDDARQEQSSGHYSSLHERGIKSSHPQAKDVESDQTELTSPNAETDQATTSNGSTGKTTESTQLLNTEQDELSTLEASSLLQIIVPASQPLIPTAVPAEAQIGALLDAEAVKSTKAETNEASADAAITVEANQAEPTGITASISSPAGAAQSSLKSANSEASTAVKGDDPTLQGIAGVSSTQSSVQNVAVSKNKQPDDKSAAAALDVATSQTVQAASDRDSSLAASVATKPTFREIIKASASDKSIDGIANLSSVASTTTESANLTKAPATTAPEAVARADAPVPLQAVAVEIGMRAMRGSKEFSIRLDPEDLGRIDIKLEISEAGEVQAKLVVERVETLQLLQRDAKTLERAFDQAGLKSNPDGLQFSLKDPGQQRDGQNNQQSERSKFNASEKDNLSVEEASTLRSFRYSSPASGGLDIRI